MTSTYKFSEIIELIDQSNKQQVVVLCDLIKEEKNHYSGFQLRVMAAAINIRLDYMEINAWLG